jgi:hypothetical protein
MGKLSPILKKPVTVLATGAMGRALGVSAGDLIGTALAQSKNIRDLKNLEKKEKQKLEKNYIHRALSKIDPTRAQRLISNKKRKFMKSIGNERTDKYSTYGSAAGDGVGLLVGTAAGIHHIIKHK